MDIINGKDYDVIVCGCGSAGFCAAIQAARLHKRVAVIEKYATPGGVLTVLGNNSIDQFNNPFRKADKMVIGGIGWEFAKRLSKLGYAKMPDMDAPYEYHWQYGVKVNQLGAAKLMDDMLLEENIDLYYDQAFVSVEYEKGDEKNHVTAIIIATKDGLKRLTAKTFIDCTGDGDLCAWAGADYHLGDDANHLQPGTLRLYPFVPVDTAKTQPSFEKWNIILYTKGDNRNHVPSYNCVDSDQKTDGEIRGRRIVYEMMENLKEEQSGIDILSCAPAVAPRESRRIIGDSYMTKEQYISGEVFDDSICYSYWFVDIHNDDKPTTIIYLKDGNTPTIRLSSMIPQKIDNVLVAGRCISTDRETNSALRVKASCMAMGQAAGVAAALAIEHGGYVRDVSLEDVKEQLSKQGAIVPGKDAPISFKQAMKD